MLFLRPPSIVKVCRRTEQGSVYIGRPSIFQNPFPVTEFDDRDTVLDKFEKYFWNEVETNGAFVAELDKLVDKAIKEGELKLGCYCSPKRYHGDVIKEYLDGKITEHMYS